MAKPTLGPVREVVFSGWACLFLALLAPVGCVHWPGLGMTDKPAPAASTNLVKTGGACLELGEPQKPALTGDQLVQKVNDYLNADQGDMARKLIRRYPDVVLETLRAATGPQAGASGVMQVIAQVHDEQCGVREGGLSWLALMRDRTANPGRYEAHDAARKKFAEYMKNGKTHDAAGLRLAKTAVGPLYEIDAQRLTGECWLLAEKPGPALEAFSLALAKAQPGLPYQTAQLTLMVGEAHRRLGKKDQAAVTWQQAVVLASQLLTGPLAVPDPTLWERAAYLRPVHCGWPDPAVQQMIKFSQGPLQLAGLNSSRPGAEEGWLWFSIGQWRQARNEPHAALLAFKRAESMFLDINLKGQVQLQEAQALLELNQQPAAMALLVQAASSSQKSLASQALAFLGEMKLTQGSGPQALALLKKAVEEGPATIWPGRAEAEANLGLAYLMTADEKNGLKWLHAAQHRFEGESSRTALLQCLDNEAKYLEHANRNEEAITIRQRMATLQSQAISAN